MALCCMLLGDWSSTTGSLSLKVLFRKACAQRALLETQPEPNSEPPNRSKPSMRGPKLQLNIAPQQSNLSPSKYHAQPFHKQQMNAPLVSMCIIVGLFTSCQGLLGSRTSIDRSCVSINCTMQPEGQGEIPSRPCWVAPVYTTRCVHSGCLTVLGENSSKKNFLSDTTAFYLVSKNWSKAMTVELRKRHSKR